MSNILNGEKTLNIIQCDFPGCFKSFCKVSKLNRHKSIHSGRNTHMCTYDSCGKSYNSKHRLKIHLQRHLNIKPFTCDICDSKFSEKGNLKIHMRIHTGERPFKCEYDSCDKRFKVYGHLKDHVNSVHLDLRPFKCTLCDQAFHRKHGLTKHKETHGIYLEDEKPKLDVPVKKKLRKNRKKKVAEKSKSSLNSSYSTNLIPKPPDNQIHDLFHKQLEYYVNLIDAKFSNNLFPDNNVNDAYLYDDIEFYNN